MTGWLRARLPSARLSAACPAACVQAGCNAPCRNAPGSAATPLTVSSLTLLTPQVTMVMGRKHGILITL